MRNIEPLKVGDRFVTVLGPRRMAYVGDCHYFNKHNRRYWCQIGASYALKTTHPARWEGRLNRLQLTVQIVRV